MEEINVAWDLIGKIAAIIGVIVAIVKGVEYLNSLTPTAKLEKRVDVIDEKQKKDFEHLQRIDAKIEHLEIQVTDTQTQIQEVNEGIRRIGKSQISLLRHFVTGNGQEEMIDEADDLTEWFIDR